MRFLSAFEVPDFARPVVDRLFAADEIALVEALTAAEFSAVEARIALETATGEPVPAERVDELLASAYRRAVIDIVDEAAGTYRLGSFYGRLELFSVTQPSEYLALPAETISALDAWCFDSYVHSLSDDERPTSDRVLPLQETLDYLDTIDRPIWLNRCDCRILAGECTKTVDTCVSFRNGINTHSHRGWSKPLTTDEAKAIVTDAHARGLVQTVNENGICNCCSDCCYLFRAQAARGSVGVWPPAEKVAVFNDNVCIGCRACIGRCPFGVFGLEEGQIVQRAELCRGCGLCADICPTYAITMEPA